ncbi:unnamed protein product, partial [Gongylonema pulchrum]|uniref:Transcriptional regulator n=1 Tax=Gongylonema pulchrum TaxID=637853 RepID=A0A183D450_9BILA
MFSLEDRIHFYVQTALTIILRLQIVEDLTAEDRSLTQAVNRQKLNRILTMCLMAVEIDPENIFAKYFLFCPKSILSKVATVELARMDNNFEKYIEALEKLRDYAYTWMERVRDGKLFAFAAWGYLCSGYYDENLSDYKSLAERFLKYAPFPGFIGAYFNSVAGLALKPGQKLTNEQTLQQLTHCRTLLSKDPENYHLFINAANYSFQ